MTTTDTDRAPDTTTQADPARVERFMQQVVTTYVNGMVALMIDIGHKTGLFEAAASGPATAAALAERAELEERYVREWLGSVTTAGIFDHDPDTETFSLPVEHAMLLTGDTAVNLAVMAPMLTHLGKHVNSVVDAFRHGGGVPYSQYRPEFTDTMDQLGRRQYDELLVSQYLPLADGLVDRLTTGADVADIGCGTGHCVNLMARAFPESRFVGYDLADDALQRGRQEAAEWGLTNVRFEQLDVATLPSDSTFDVITAFDAIHDQVDPAGVLRRIRGALAHGGTFFMVDIKASSDLEENRANPLAPLLYGISVLHCMTVSLAGGGAGLGTVWGEQVACRMLRDAGFQSVDVHDLLDDPFNIVYVCR